MKKQNKLKMNISYSTPTEYEYKNYFIRYSNGTWRITTKYYTPTGIFRKTVKEAKAWIDKYILPEYDIPDAKLKITKWSKLND